MQMNTETPWFKNKKNHTFENTNHRTTLVFEK